MKWLEIIKLREADKSSGVLEKIFLSRGEIVQKGLIKFELYRHAFLETDLSVHLQWDSDEPEIRGSTLGLHLAQGLKNSGWLIIQFG